MLIIPAIFQHHWRRIQARSRSGHEQNCPHHPVPSQVLEILHWCSYVRFRC